MFTWQVQLMPAVQGPVGPLHGMPLQQSEAIVHDWPYSEQGMPLLEDALVLLEVLLDVLLLLLVPPSGGGAQGPHVPCAVPSGWMQVDPRQQSASTVHEPQFGTHGPPW
jgi:hypothetical protein